MPGEVIGALTLDKVYRETDRRLRNLEQRILGRSQGPSFLPDGSLFTPNGLTFGDGSNGATLSADAPDQPTNLVLVGGSTDNRIFLDVSWDFPADTSDIDGYIVEINTVNAPTRTAYVITNSTRMEPLIPGAAYNVSVRSIGINGVYSAALTGNFGGTVDTTAPATAPGGFTITPSFRSIMLRWSPVPDSDVANAAGDYEVERATDDLFTAGVQTVRVAGTTVTFTGLVTGATYYFRVRAVDSSGNRGPWSVTGSGATLPTDKFDYKALSIENAAIAEATIEHGKILTVDANKITTGTLSADRIGALTITANKLNVIAGSGNKVDNSSFQTATSGFADSWVAYNSPGTDPAPTITRVTDGVHGGNALRIQWTTNNGYKGITQAINVGGVSANGWQANGVWMVSLWLKGNQLPTLVWDTTGFTVTPISSPALSASLFQRYVFKVTTVGARNSNLYVAFQGANGDVTLDAVQVEEGDVPSGYSPKVDEILPGTVNAAMLNADLAILGQIRSPNHNTGNPGAGGWAIKADGSVYFNDGTFKGNIIATSGTFSGNISSSATISGGTFRTNSQNIDVGGSGLILKAPPGAAADSQAIRFLRDDYGAEFARISSFSLFGGATAGRLTIDASYGGGTLVLRASTTSLLETSGSTVFTVSNSEVKAHRRFSTTSGHSYTLYGSAQADIYMGDYGLNLRADGDTWHRMYFDSGINGVVVRGKGAAQFYASDPDAHAILQSDGNFVLYDNGQGWGLKGTGSSLALKRDIVTLETGALDKVNALRPVSFKRIWDYKVAEHQAEYDAKLAEVPPVDADLLRQFNADLLYLQQKAEVAVTRRDAAIASGKHDRVEIGFIAEEVEAVDSRLIMPATDDSPIMLQYAQATALLAKAIQELDDKVDALAAQLP